MVDITFGNLNQIDGKNVLTGGQSGIDTDGLIESLAAARRLPAVKLETSIETNISKITALGSFESKLTALQNSLNALRRPSGFGTSQIDVFASRLAFQTASDGSTAGSYFGIVAQNGAAIRSYDVEVLNLAVAESRRSITFSSQTDSVVNASGDETSSFFSEGTFQINGVNISLSEGESLIDIAAKINLKSGDTNVQASILKLSDNQFRFVISGTETGLDNAITITDATDNVFVGGDESDIFATTIAAENSSVSIDGDVVSRQGNIFSDVVDGVTFSLFQETDELPNAPTVRVDVGVNTQAISEAVVGFIDAYNDLRVFYGQQTARDSGGQLLETSVLSNSSVFKSINDRILSEITNVTGIDNPLAFGSNEQAPETLTDLGISLADFDGDDANELAATTSILEIDIAKLSSHIESNFDAVRDIFGFEFSSSSTSLNVFSHGNVNVGDYTIQIDESNFGSEVSVISANGEVLVDPDFDFSYTVGGSNNGFSELDGSTQYIEVPNINFGTKAFSASASVSIDDFSSPNIVLGGSSTDNYTLNIKDDSTISIRASNSGNVYEFNLPEALDINTFYNFKVSRSGNDISIDITGGDEPLFSEQTIIGTDRFELGVIGGNNNPAIASLDGKVRDVRIINDGKLEASYLLDRDFNDRSGNNNHATATGAPNQTRSTSSTASIKSDADSIMGQFNLIYSGDGSDTIDLSFTQGIADVMFNYLEEVSTGGNNSVQGIIEDEITNLTTSNDSIQESIDRIDIQVNFFTEQLLLKFSALEEAIAASSSILELLEAQTNAANNN